MLKNGEKVIFKIKSGYGINGLEDFDLADKWLQLTNLGNIFVSKVDCLQGQSSDYLMYNYTEERMNLYSELDGDNINIITELLPFTMVRGEFKTKLYLSLIMILDLDEFALINNQIKNMIFDFRQGDIILTADGKYTYAGEIEKAEKRLVFNSGKNRFEFNFTDVEVYSSSENRINFKGYFYMDKDSIVMRDISFVGSIDQYTLPRNFEELIKDNKRIGRLPKSDPIVFCKLSGRIRGNDYLLKNMFLIRHEDIFVLYEKKQKREIICKEISEFTKFNLGNGNYIIYDGEDVYNMYINDKNAELVGFNKLKMIDEQKIGFTKELRPFFLDVDDEYIRICKGKDKCVLEIEKLSISDISVHEENSIDSEFFVETEIKFKDKYIKLNLRRNLITELSANIFSEYQNSILEVVSVDEVYENWTKSVSDMIVYNFFGHIYELNRKYANIGDSNIGIYEKVNFINDIYKDIQIQLKNLDLISVYMSEILEKNEIKYFKGLGIESDFDEIQKLERVFFDLRNDIKSDLNSISKSIEVIGYMILPEEMRKSSIRLLKESQLYQVDYFSMQAYDKMSHITYDLLPHYISKTVKTIFTVYESIKDNYIKLDSDDVKQELMERIKAAHIFRQFAVGKESTVLRKEVIEDLYSLMKFGTMKIDSEFYYTGGYR